MCRNNMRLQYLTRPDPDGKTKHRGTADEKGANVLPAGFAQPPPGHTKKNRTLGRKFRTVKKTAGMNARRVTA